MRIIQLVSVLAVLAASTTASAQQTDGRCFPACRPGFFCVEAECVSMCNPACAPGMLCSPQGQCVSACNPACGPGTVCSPQGQCVSACNPPCGPGTLCSPQGQCVSACNPPCAAGQTCTAAGTCAGPTATPGPGAGGGPQVWGPGATAGGSPAAWGPGAAPPANNAPPALMLQSGTGTYGGVSVAGGGPGWARTAGILGIVTAIGLTALTAATIATNGDEDTSIPLGITATVFGAAMIPIVALGAGSARDNPAVDGAPGLRTAAWVAYALALGDALVLIGLSLADATIDGAVTASVGVLGLLSDLGMTIDAYASASEAEETTSPMGGVGLFIAPAGVEHSGAMVGLAGAM